MKLLVITQKHDINDSNLGAFVGWWNKLAERIEKVYVLTLEYRSGSKSASNIEILSMGKEKGAGFWRKFFGFYLGLLKTIRKVDAILIHMVPKYAILAAPAAFIFRKPIYMWYTGVAAQRQLKFSVLFCRKVFTAHAAAMRIDTKKRIITGHGIDTDKFQISNIKSQISTVTILSVGRITPSKGHDFVIRAVAALIKSRSTQIEADQRGNYQRESAINPHESASNYNLKLKIIGGVIQKYHLDYFARLRKLVDDLKMEARIEFLGDVAYYDMPRYFNEARILINAVPFGGLDKVVLEAMASGVIPLTSNNAFLSVFPKDLAFQLVFKENDSEDLKNKLKNILDKKLYLDEILTNQLRDIVVRNHNLDNLINKIIEEIKK